MRKVLAVLLLLLIASFVQTACAASINSRDLAHASMLEIYVTTKDGTAGRCTAYAVGPHTIATAEHCFEGNPMPQLSQVFLEDREDAQPEPVEAILLDKNDHALVIFKTKTFSTWVILAITVPKQGERVYMWGNPRVIYGAEDCYREGYYSGIATVLWRGNPLKWRVFIMNVAPGDSGSLIFNEDGFVVGQVSKAPSAGFTISMEFGFTPAQLDRAAK